MTDDKRLEDLIALGRRVRERINALIVDIERRPIDSDIQQVAVNTWRSVLLTLVWDIGDAALILAETRTNQLRTLRILVRCLFEYVMRLEFYVTERGDAEKHWRNQEAWFVPAIKAGISSAELSKWTSEERHAYNEMISVKGGFERLDVSYMVRKVLWGRGYRRKQYRSAVRYTLSNFYYVASSYVHGSQGVFYDVLEASDEQPADRPTGVMQTDVRLKSFRLTALQLTKEVVFHLIGAVFAESRHQERDLGADFYWRELDLISGAD